MSAARFLGLAGWGRCALVARFADIARCLERRVEVMLDPIFMSLATWWLLGWIRSPECWRS